METPLNESSLLFAPYRDGEGKYDQASHHQQDRSRGISRCRSYQGHTHNNDKNGFPKHGGFLLSLINRLFRQFRDVFVSTNTLLVVLV
jgi:hypothetical protein